MVNPTILIPIRNISKMKHIISNTGIFSLKLWPKSIHSCICGKKYIDKTIILKKPYIGSLYSTQSKQHRQKVVFGPSTPKIEIEKVPSPAGGSSKVQTSAIYDWKCRIDPYVKLMRLDKPIGIYLLYWPCTWSIALGAIHTGIPLTEAINMLALFGAGAVVMRGAGCTINDMWDNDIDAKVERTKNRPLVSGAVSKRQAIAFLALQLSVALTILLQLNWYSVALGASSMALVLTYPLAKRFTNYPQLVLGLTFNWGALLGYTSVVSHLDAVCGWLYLAGVQWTLLYDTVYAHQDKIDDARIGIKSTALTFGDRTKPALYSVTAGCTCSLLAAGAMSELSSLYYAAVTAATAHAITQIYTLNTDNPEDCARKFKSNTWIGFLIFLGIVGGGYHKYLENRQKVCEGGTENVSVKQV